MAGGTKFVLLVLLFCSLCSATEWVEAPSNITVDNEGIIYSLTCRWTPPIGNYEYQYIHYKSADSSKWKGGSGSRMVSPSVSVNVITTNSLSAGVPYYVSIKAVNHTSGYVVVGDEGFAQGRTLPMPIVNMTESGETNSSITAQWPKPTHYHDFYYGEDLSYVDQYIVYCVEGTVQPDTPIPESYDGELHEASCMGLPEAGAMYTIHAWAQSGDELSDMTSINITTLPNPVDLSAGESTLNSVSATWSTPSGYVSMYEVECSEDGVPLPQFIDQPEYETDFEAMCTDFSITGGEYVMTVSSMQNEKKNPFNITLRAVPNKPSLSEGSAGNDSITATWPIPEGVADFFTVNCSSGYASPAILYVMEDSLSFQASCINLPVAGDWSTMTVTSVSLGMTNTTDITLQALPNHVDLMEGESTFDSVSATWSKPSGYVSMYEVECSESEPFIIEQTDVDTDFEVTCSGFSITGGEYAMNVSSIQNDKKNPTGITLRAVPNRPSLTASYATNDSITATWPMPEGVVDYFEVNCSHGYASPHILHSMDDSEWFNASCIDLPVAGDWPYTIYVTSVSRDRTNTSLIYLQALPNEAILREESSTNQTVSASWLLPNGIVTQFRIYCSRGSPIPSDIYSLGADTQFNASCIGLDRAGDEYYMSVETFAHDISSLSLIYLYTLPNKVELQYSFSSNDSVSTVWERPPGDLDHYEIACIDDGIPYPLNIPNGEGPFTAYCTDLPTSGAIYTITVFSVSNANKTDSSSIELQALPNAAGLVADTQTNETVFATWAKPSGLIDFFDIYCSEGNADPSYIENRFFIESYNVSCTNLPTAGAFYNMTVRSVVGDMSNTAQIQLQALPNIVDLMEGAPTSLSVSASWNLPPGRVTHFYTFCSSGFADPYLTNISNGDTDFSASCVYLPTAGEMYLMTVSSYSDSIGNPTDILLRALPNAVSLTEGSSSVESVSVLWNKPSGVLSKFQIECSEGVADPSTITDLSSSTFSASCVYLDVPGDEYNVTVKSFSGDKIKTASKVLTAVPLRVTLYPGRPTSTSVNASWSHPGGVVEYFYLECSNGTGSFESLVINVDDDDDDVYMGTCEDLWNPGDDYTMTVSSVSTNQYNSTSIELSALPEAVELRVAYSTISSIAVSWDIPNGIFEYFEVFCPIGIPSPSKVYPSDQLIASCGNLEIPGENYTISVATVMGDLRSENATLTITTRTTDGTTDVVTMTTWDLMTTTDTTMSTPDQTTTPVPTTDEDMTTPWWWWFSTRRTTTPTPRTPKPTRWGLTTELPGFSTEGPTMPVTDWTSTSTGRTTARSTPDQTTKPEDVTMTTWDQITTLTTTSTPDQTTTLGTTTDRPATTASRLTTPLSYEDPSGVRNASAYVVDKNTAIVTYEMPEHPAGVIVLYMISYTGNRDGVDDDIGSAETQETQFTFTDLFPGLSYIFSIIAVNDRELQSDPVETNTVVMPQEEPSPVEPDYPYEEKTEVSQVSHNSITVQLPEDLFSHDNGVLTSFSVIISESDNTTAMATTSLSYEQAKYAGGEGIWPPYISVENMEYPYPPQFNDAKLQMVDINEATGLVEIGTESCSGNANEYCNGPLKEETQYYYSFRAYNDIGSVSSGTFGPVKTANEVPVVLIAVAVSVSLVLLIIIIAIGFMCIRKRGYSNLDQGGQSNQAFEEEHFELSKRINRKPGSSMHKKNLSKPILLSDYDTIYKRLKTDAEYKFAEEFEALRSIGKDHEIVAATRELNRAKNRYTNILPYDHSRVKLGAMNDEPDTDYINASYIPGYTSPREFISCQGPLPGTVDDMIRLIWEKRSTIVVMLTHLVEGGKDKCYQYWPAEKGASATYGSIEVMCSAEVQLEHWTIRTLILLKDGMKRKVTQFQFTSWPDHGVPDSTWIILEFVRDVRKHIQKQSLGKPVVVHCSAGVGRTGVYIALDRLIQHMRDNDFVDIFGAVCEMRMQRNYMVQTENQYIFIHDCVNDILMNSEDPDISAGVQLV